MCRLHFETQRKSHQYIEFLFVFTEKLDLILQHPDIQQMQQQMSIISKQLPAMPDFSIYVKKVKSAMKKVDMKKPYNEVVTKVTSVLQTKYDELQKDQDFVKFQTLMKEIYEEVQCTSFDNFFYGEPPSQFSTLILPNKSIVSIYML